MEYVVAIILNGHSQVDITQEGVQRCMQYVIEKNWIILKELDEDCVAKFFEKYIPSKKIRHNLIQNKWITIDYNTAKREDNLIGKQLKIRIYSESIVSKPSRHIHIQVIYEDPFLIIVNKPAGIMVHSNGTDEVTLQDCIDYYFWSNYKFGSPAPIHRLDKDTTGLVMFSKSPVFQPLFDSLVSRKKIERQYLAFVRAKVNKGEKYIFTDPIGNDRFDSNRRVVSKKGKSAITEVCSLGTNGKISVLKCRLQTGRTHQIRVHLSYHGFPIINDSLYGASSNELKKMGLVGNYLCFFHPILNQTIELQLPLEQEFLGLLSKI